MCLYLLIFALFTQWISILSYDLCSNSRVDSIAYIDDAKQYFITSCGHYWLVKENEMPPKTGGKPMPDGWFGDGAAYINGLKNNCKDSSEQLVLVINQNMYKLFDLRSHSWSNTKTYNELNKISHFKLNRNQRMDALFDFKEFEIYAVQNDKYAASDWSAVCQGKAEFTENYDPNESYKDFETNKKIDAIMVVSPNLYVFTGDEFFVMPLDMTLSGKGKIQRASKGSVKSVRKYFFNCTSGSAVKCKSGTGSILWIIIVIILLIIVVAVIAFIAFLYLRKRKTSVPSKQKSGAKLTKHTKAHPNVTRVKSKRSLLIVK